MRRMLPLLGALLLAPAALAAPPERTTIADAAIANPAFSTLVAAVVKADLVATLDGNRQLTVFAPTNDAFDAAAVAILGAGKTGIDLVDALTVEELTDVLLYHVAPGSRDSGAVLGADKVRMLNKDFTTPAITGGVPTINGVEIVAPDVAVSNGIIHVIGGVLLPPAE